LARHLRSVYRSRMDTERRVALRSPLHLYFNKYIDGVPHLCETIELSMTGMLLRSIHEPDASRACYAVELARPDAVPAAGPEASPEPQADRRVWLCATPVWRVGRYEALSFLAPSHLDRLKLADLLAAAA
jgi:hypothetical protein